MAIRNDAFAIKKWCSAMKTVGVTNQYCGFAITNHMAFTVETYGFLVKSGALWFRRQQYSTIVVLILQENMSFTIKFAA